MSIRKLHSVKSRCNIETKDLLNKSIDWLIKVIIDRYFRMDYNCHKLATELFSI